MGIPRDMSDLALVLTSLLAPCAVADAYTREGLLGVVLLSAGSPKRKILVYNDKKKQCFTANILADNVALYAGHPFSFRVETTGDESHVHVLSFKSAVEQVKFGVQVAISP